MSTFTLSGHATRFKPGHSAGVRLGSVPEAFRCRAKAKSTGRPCQCIAMTGRGLCKLHGGKRQGDAPTGNKLKRLARQLQGLAPC